MSGAKWPFPRVSRTPTLDKMERELHDAIDRLIEQQPVVRRAFALADRHCMEVIVSDCIPIDAGPSEAQKFALVSERYGEVHKLADASADVREAVDWLRERGCVEMASDEYGEYVQVLRRPTA